MKNNGTSPEAANTTTGNDQLPDKNKVNITTGASTTASAAKQPVSSSTTTINQGPLAESATQQQPTSQLSDQQSKAPSTDTVGGINQHQQQFNINSSMASDTANTSSTVSNYVESSTVHSNAVVVPQVLGGVTSAHQNTNAGPAYHHHHPHQRHSNQNYHGGHQASHHQQHYQQQQHPHHHHHQQQHHHQQHHPHHQNSIGNQNNSKYNHRGDNESNINHVLLMTVINPHYNITCDLIHQITNTWGKVNRIVIFRRNGVQAMVEFDNVESAKEAKMNLHGCDIYTGCCTLRIEYAKPTRLNVHKNNSDSFDYTNPNLGSGQVQQVSNNSNEVHEVHPGNLNESQQQTANESSSIAGQMPLQHQHQNHQAVYNPNHGGGHIHHHRGIGSNRRGGLGGGGHPHHHTMHQAPHHHHVHQQHHSQQHGKQGADQAIETGGPYMDKSAGPSGDPSSFHQEAGFNRAGPPSNYVAMDSYMQGPPHGPVHGPPYQRQDGQAAPPTHHHHHHHHPHPRLGISQGSGGVTHGNHNHSSYVGNTASSAVMPGQNLVPPLGTVMMVYGLHPDRINCDRLFNLLCLYGNVVRIKFLRTKEGCAMVQMGDLTAVDRCVSSLNKITLFSNEIQLSYSKQPFLHDVVQPFILPDGSPSFKDFTNNKNNRFKNPEVASKNRILPPSHVLHFFNAPIGSTEDGLASVFELIYGHRPVSLKVFTPKADATKNCSGLVTFRNASEASEALVMCNHLTMPKEGSAQHPYILRLCFSPPTYSRSTHYTSPPNQSAGSTSN